MIRQPGHRQHELALTGLASRCQEPGIVASLQRAIRVPITMVSKASSQQTERDTFSWLSVKLEREGSGERQLFVEPLLMDRYGIVGRRVPWLAVPGGPAFQKVQPGCTR